MLTPGRLVPAALADAEVLDPDGKPTRLGDRWEDAPALVVFLRHFGCIACSEHVTLLMPRTHELHGLGVNVVFVGNGEARYIEGFVERHGIVPELVEVLTDPSREAFTAAGLVRGFWRTFGPRAGLNALRARLMGNRQGSIEGDNLQQGGVLVIDRGGTLVYAHADESLGDHADTIDVVDAAMRVAAAGAAVA